MRTFADGPKPPGYGQVGAGGAEKETATAGGIVWGLPQRLAVIGLVVLGLAAATFLWTLWTTVPPVDPNSLQTLDAVRSYVRSASMCHACLGFEYEIPLASHDDTTEENVIDAIRDRVSVAEFPTTMEAAHGLHRAGISVLMGAPNVVRGGSHSGNIAAVDLAREGLLDILSSDYVPSSLLMGALQLPQRVPAIDLASAIRTVTKTPAEAVGLHDRGEIKPGKRADMIRVHVARDVPVVRSVWREGQRVA